MREWVGEARKQKQENKTSQNLKMLLFKILGFTQLPDSFCHSLAPTHVVMPEFPLFSLPSRASFSIFCSDLFSSPL